MKKDIPLKIEIFSRGEDDQHRLTSAKEIELILRYIAEKKTRVALYYDYGNAGDFILTTVLDVDSNGLWLEQSPNGSENWRITQSSKLVFVSSQLQAKVQFTVHQVNSVMHQGYAAFYLPLPDSIFRLQRREYYRLATPTIEPLRCVITTAKPPTHKRPSEFTIMDISGGGVGLTCTESDTELVSGETYPNCRIDLPEVGAINVTIQVKTLAVETSTPGHTHKRAGCEFKNLDGQSTILLQRYITNMQRAAKTKTSS